MTMKKRPYNDPSLADFVTHGDLQEELQRLRSAILLLASHVPHDISHESSKRLLDLCAPPHERQVIGPDKR